MKAFRAALPPLKVAVNRAPPRSGRRRHRRASSALGVPFVDFNQDMSRYFDLHHSADDTLDKIDPAELAQNVAVWAAFLYTVANSDVDFRPKPRRAELALRRAAPAVCGGSRLGSAVQRTLSPMPDGTATSHLYRPKLATTLAEGYGLRDLRARRHGRPDRRHPRPAALHGHRRGLGRLAGPRPLYGDRRRLPGLGPGRQPLQIGGPAGAFIVLVAATVAKFGDRRPDPDGPAVGR